ncbi:MAG: 30S ribosomal protein S13 [Planctomycetes bacterium]|nr:30S ribosomal protein S13 [Planctomycetota bacterium]
MPRIIGKDIPDNKQVWISLTYISGIGQTTAVKLCDACGIDSAKKARELSEDEKSRLTQEIEASCLVEGQLRRSVAADITRLRKIGSFRGIRHSRGLPVRGQRTQTNARTRKGKRKTVAGKKSVKDMK